MKHYIQRACQIIAREGASTLFQRIIIRIKALWGISFYGNFDQGYQRWLKQFDRPLSQSEADQHYQGLTFKPLFSIIIPVYNVDPRWLQAAIESVRNQSYPHWQLCIADDASTNTDTVDFLKSLANTDPRIVIRINRKNAGISATSNAALELAQGHFVGLLDHDDLLAKDALLHNATEINSDKTIDLLYSDEDKIAITGKRHTPFFKPDFSPELFHSQNYIGHFVVARKSLVDQAGGFRSKYDGAQDYDLLLRLVPIARSIKHIPKILYHWREIPGSTAAVFSSKSYADEAGRLALEDYFSKQPNSPRISNGDFPGTYSIRHTIREQPKVSIILPFKDQPELLNRCLNSLFDQTTWQPLEVIAINNNSEQTETHELIKTWKAKNSAIQFSDYSQPFNYSKICNQGVNIATGEIVVLLNSDIEIMSDHWIESLLGFALQKDIGAVGAKLTYPDNTIQHAGIVVGIDNGAGHPYKHFPENHRGYFLRLGLTHNVSAVTGALLMVTKEKYQAVGGLDESDFAIAYNDVDFCLKLMSAGYRNVLNPDCQATHHESSTRGYDLGTEKLSRHEAEKQRLREKWSQLFESGDPYYNQNLTLTREDYSLNFEPGKNV